MSASEVSKLLSRSEACKGLSAEELEVIASAGSVKVGWEGGELMKEGEPGDSMIMLLDGRVAVLKSDENGRTREIAVLESGAVIGEIALLESVPRTATVKATAPIRYFEMDRGAFAGLLAENSRAAGKMLLALARALARRQRATNERLVALLVEVTQRGGGGSTEIGRAIDELVIEWES